MKIDPERLRRLRNDKGLSRARLGEQARISERTIQRLELEAEQSQSTREHTLRRLAKALGVEESVLTGEAPLPDSGGTAAPDTGRVAIGAQIAPKARLAYDLVRRRYGVSATEIINMAPLFFVLLAEGSLARRREELEQVGEAIDRLDQVGPTTGSWIFGPGAYRAGEARRVEQESIDANDVFGERLFDSSNLAFLDEPFDPAEGNPFASYLRRLADALGNPGAVGIEQNDLSYGSPLRFPDYDICRDELDDITNGSPDARRALETGNARLAAIPEELTGEEAGAARAAWLKDTLPEAFRDLQEGEILAELADLEATSTSEEAKQILKVLFSEDDDEETTPESPEAEQGAVEDE